MRHAPSRCRAPSTPPRRPPPRPSLADGALANTWKQAEGVLDRQRDHGGTRRVGESLCTVPWRWHPLSVPGLVRGLLCRLACVAPPAGVARTTARSRTLKTARWRAVSSSQRTAVGTVDEDGATARAGAASTCAHASFATRTRIAIDARDRTTRSLTPPNPTRWIRAEAAPAADEGGVRWCSVGRGRCLVRMHPCRRTYLADSRAAVSRLRRCGC